MRRQSWTQLPASPVVSNILVTGPLCYLACMAAAVSSLPLAENPQPRGQTCWEHLLCSLPLFLSSLPSLHFSVATSLLNLSLPFLSSASTFPPLPSYLHLFSSVSPSLLPCISALPNHRRDSSTVLPKTPQVLVYLAWCIIPVLHSIFFCCYFC